MTHRVPVSAGRAETAGERSRLAIDVLIGPLVVPFVASNSGLLSARPSSEPSNRVTGGRV